MRLQVTFPDGNSVFFDTDDQQYIEHLKSKYKVKTIYVAHGECEACSS
jgi:hypothetical protein